MAVPASLPAIPNLELLETLGEGGMGVVYRAKHQKLQRQVAVKLLRQHRWSDPRVRQRFEREMAAVGQLDHPNIVRAYDAGEVEGTPYLVLEYLQGRSLRDVVNGRGALPVGDACEVIRQSALGLQYAHDNGLVHRDIKPENLFLTNTGVVKLLDLGLVRGPLVSGDSKTQPGHVLGTPGFMAPEQTDDAGSVTPLADVFSLGCTFYTLLTGRTPFQGANVHQRIAASQSQTPTPIAQLVPDCPPPVAALVDRMMKKNPTERVASAAEVAQLLAPLSSGGLDFGQLVVESSTTLEYSPDSTSERSSKKLWLALGGLLVVGLVCVLAFAFSGGDPDPAPGDGPKLIDDPSKRAEPGKAKPTKPLKGAALASLGTLSGCASPPIFLEVSPTESLAVSSTRKILSAMRFWDLDSKKQLQELEKNVILGPMGFSPDGKVLAVSNNYGNLVFWDVADRKAGETWERCHESIISQVRFSPDGKFVATAGARDGFLRVWHYPSGKKHRQFKHGGQALSLAFSSDGRHLVSGSVDPVIRVWDIAGDKQAREFERLDPPLEASAPVVAFSPDAELVYSFHGKRDNRDANLFTVWDRANGTVRNQFTIEELQYHTPTVAVSPTGRLVAAGYRTGKVILWNALDGKKLFEVQGHQRPVVSFAFSADERTLLSGSEDLRIRIWKVESEEN